MASLAVRNLLHDKVRLAVTLTGIVFAVVLGAVETGLFIGFTTTTSNVIDHSAADFWIVSRGVRYIEVGVPSNSPGDLVAWIWWRMPSPAACRYPIYPAK